MLSDREKEGVRLLLNKLSNEELKSLKDTITKRQISAVHRQEAVKVIIEYSESASELLHRKKLRRDFIFQYLADCNVVVPVTLEKYELIQRTLQYWGSRELQRYDQGDVRGHALPDQQEGGRNSAGASISATSSADGGQRSQAAAHTISVPSATNQLSSSSQPHKHQALAETFLNWFYNLLNSQNPTNNNQPGDFGPNHFWENSTLKLVSRTPDVKEETFAGSVLVAQRFLALAREELLVFNPNISAEGMKVTSNPHGLVIIMVCGTIHQHNSCLGVFEQMFGLIKDSLDETTWKIKTSQLHLSSSQVTAIPKLMDSNSFVRGALALLQR